MSPIRALVPSLLLSALLATACSTSVFPIKRDPPPPELLRVPERPALAPVDAGDNELAEERVRIGAWGIKLEGQLRRLICYVVECTVPASQPAPATPFGGPR